MDAIIVEQPAFRLVGHAVRLPLKHNGINPHLTTPRCLKPNELGFGELAIRSQPDSSRSVTMSIPTTLKEANLPIYTASQ